MADNHYIHPLHPHLHGAISFENQQLMFQWRDENEKVKFTTPIKDFVKTLEEHARELGFDPYANPETSTPLRELADRIEELTSLFPAPDTSHSSSPERR